MIKVALCTNEIGQRQHIDKSKWEKVVEKQELSCFCWECKLELLFERAQRFLYTYQEIWTKQFIIALIVKSEKCAKYSSKGNKYTFL